MKVLKKILKIVGYVIGSILLLLLLIILLIQTPPGQDFIRKKAVAFFENKVDSEASIGKLFIGFPKDLVLEDLYIEDQQQDTLAYLKELRLSADMWGLFKGNLDVSSVELDGFVGYMSRNEADSAFNFDFIIKAFTTPDSVIAKQPPSNAGMTITFGGLQITDSRFYYTDPIAGFRMGYGVQNFEVDISKSDLDSMILHVDAVVLEDAYGEFIQETDVPTVDEVTEPFAFELKVGDVTINNVRFSFESKPDKIKLFTNVGHIDGVMEEIDIQQMNYFADYLNLENTVVELDIYGESSVDTLNNKPSALDSVNLNVGGNSLAFSNVDFRFDDHAAPEAPGFDPMHFAFADIMGKLSNPKYILKGTDNYATGTVESLTLSEEAGMDLNQLEGYVEFTPTHTFVRDLKLLGGNTKISGTFRLSYASLESMAADPMQIGLEIDMAPSQLNLNDVVYFVPDLSSQINTLPRSARQVQMEGEMSGKVSALDLSYFQLHGLRNTHIDLKGHLVGIPDIKKLNADLVIRQFETTLTDIMTVVPDTLIPQDITLPESFSITGRIKGDMEEAVGNLNISTSMGNAVINASILQQSDSLYSYKGEVSVDDFNIGRLLQQEEMLGKLSLNINADGEGFTLENLNTKVNGTVESVEYNGYTYNGLQINGNLFKKEFSGDLAMADPNLDFTFQGTVDMNDSIPAFMFFMDINNANFQALNLLEEDIRFEGEIDSDLKTASLKSINGHIGIEDAVVYKGEEQYTLDSLRLNSEKYGRQSIITLHSDIVDARFEGEFEVFQLPMVIQAHVNQYYDLLDTTSLEGVEPQSFTFNVNVKDTRLIEVLVPGLEALEVGAIAGEYNSEAWEMDINIAVPYIDYSGITLDSLYIKLTSDEEALYYDARLGTLQTGIAVKNLWLEGLVQSNHINTSLHILDTSGADEYLFGGIFTSWEEQYFQLQMTPGRIILNYEPWDVYPGNAIQFYPSGLIIEDLRLSHEEQQINVETNIDDKQDTLLNVGFNNFLISTVGKIIARDTNHIEGILNGKADINMSAETFAFTSDMGIRNIIYKTDTLGNLSLNAFSSEGDRYNLTASLDGYNNSMLIEGYYEADSTAGIINIDANLQSLSIKAFEAFSMGEIQDSRGFLTGEIAVRGTINSPDVKGFLGFEDVMARIDYTRAWVMIDDEQIIFDNSGIHLNDFVINDGSNNNFNLNGSILTDNYTSFKFDLEGYMRNFLMVNSGAGDNPLFYGTLIMDADLTVAGDSQLPIISMDINLNDESRMTYIVPETQITTIEREGLIEWVDPLAAADSLSLSERLASDTLEARIQGLNFTANINVDETNVFNVVIDPATGDRLSNLRGNANLALNINSTGTITLNGRYTVEEGHYTLRFFGLTRREFNIASGSYILWTGDPLNARIDIKAQYDLLASPKPLIAQQGMAGVQYQKQPIVVNLNLEGRLLNPEIGFELTMPEGEQRSGTMALLQEINSQESRQLEEVLSLVVFQRFSGGNILAGGGGGAEGTARQSVSRLLSQQLNDLGSRVKGVDLTFDVQSYEDYSQTGTYNRTDVELGLSKQFLNNRVIVKVAGNFNVEGEQNANQQNTTNIAGDVVVEYLITKDGRFRLMVFRKNEYDDLLQGLITETGMGVIFVKDYDTLEELFTNMNNEGG